MTQPLTALIATHAAVLFEKHAASVANRLEREFPWADPDVVSEATVEAILEAAQEPNEFDPRRGPFESFLYWLAREHLRTVLRSEKRRKAREEKKAATDVTRTETAAPLLDDDPCDLATVRELKDALAHTDAERVVLDLWLNGVNAPRDVARALGFGRRGSGNGSVSGSGDGSGDDDAIRRAKVLLARLRQRIHRERERRKPQPRQQELESAP